MACWSWKTVRLRRACGCSATRRCVGNWVGWNRRAWFRSIMVASASCCSIFVRQRPTCVLPALAWIDGTARRATVGASSSSRLGLQDGAGVAASRLQRRRGGRDGTTTACAAACGGILKHRRSPIRMWFRAQGAPSRAAGTHWPVWSCMAGRSAEPWPEQRIVIDP